MLAEFSGSVYPPKQIERTSVCAPTVPFVCFVYTVGCALMVQEKKRTRESQR